MPVQVIGVHRFTIRSWKQFDQVLQAIDASIGHPDTNVVMDEIAVANNDDQFKNVIDPASGSSGVVEFSRIDLTPFMRFRRSVRIIAGDPMVMCSMAGQIPEAAAYGTVAIQIDERADGVRLSYDRIAERVEEYEDKFVFELARNLEKRIESLLTAASQ
jgi:hypothetical protein